MRWEYVPLEPLDVHGSLLVVGMPSVGMVGSVAASFLAEQLQMRVVGGIQGDALPPMAVIRDGLATSPIQMWATETVCGPDGRCDRLLVLKSDVPLPPEELMPLASLVTSWAKENGVGLIIGLEGYPDESAGGEGLMVGSSLDGREAAKALGLTVIKEAAMTAFTAAVLVRANRERIPALAILAPVKAKEGDARAAAAVLQAIDSAVPNIHFAADELAKRAADIETELRRARDQHEQATRRMAEGVDRSYV